jgi:hypothetical protein
MKDITGKMFNNLIVIGFSHYNKGYINKKGILQRDSFWLCKCVCGNQKVIPRKTITLVVLCVIKLNLQVLMKILLNG